MALLITPFLKLFRTIGFIIWDMSYTLANIILPKRRIGHVTPEGHPGAAGKWPEYIAPTEGDSRCSCPALNTLANHGILPRDGKNISFTAMGDGIRSTYNCSTTFCWFVPNYAAEMLKKSYNKDTIELSELDLHNGIEHDASLCREDVFFAPDQSKPHVPFIKELLSYASGKDSEGNPLLTAADVARFSSKRRADARASNPNFTLSFAHKMFSSSNSSTMVNIFGGRVRDLESFLIHERLPDGWESRIRSSLGLTVATFNRTVLKIEWGINEKKYLEDKAAHRID